ncbi:hypothetical protein [Halapricum salinum]|uniref:Glycosyltransferase RgtA/B/C/D-like domain-containing protein n=1 Tax=Halapricum salinum TaxID=1457250 RepID=A0A4D6HF84_9EURY|nr:hypothetical protein [Halapricum salinum]QCC51828.1 hypothetical protein DV733_11535 [Halapricum salinum]
MSDSRTVSAADVSRVVARIHTRSVRAGRLVVGDQRGLALFLGSLCYIALLTRVGIFITDTYTTANAFVALTEGHLSIERAVFGPSLDTPGMHVVDGQLYGRNYGQLVLSLPAYWLLEGASVVADLRIALVAVWSLALLWFSVVLGRILDYRRAFALSGCVLALVLFLANVAVATPVPEAIVPVLAMQLTSILSGALVAVFAYRLVGYLATPRVGVVAGVLVVLGTPIGFWAPIPKRHVFTTLCVLLALFAFAKSRDPETPRRDLVHGGAYAAVALLAWIHAPEALVLLVTLVVADFASSPAARYRSLPVVGGVFVLALVPFFLTNFLIAGNPFVPPRLLRSFDIADAGSSVVDPGGADGDPTADPGSGGSGGGGGSIVESLVGLLDAIVTAGTTFVRLLVGGVETATERTSDLYRTFVRSGYVVANSGASEEAINLSVLESAPVLGSAVAVPLAAVNRLRANFDPRRLRDPRPATALAVVVFTALFTLLYVERLPLHAQVTVRYLIPLYPVSVVGLVLLTPIERVCRKETWTVAWTVAGGVLIGGQVVAAFVLSQGLALGEAFQFHALVGLGLAGVLAVGATATPYTDRFDRVVAGAIGLATAGTVVFSLLVVTAYATGLGRYPVDGGQLLPILRVLADLLSAV